jgi:hypothetical protein
MDADLDRFLILWMIILACASVIGLPKNKR